MAHYTQENGPRARLGRGRNRNTVQNISSKQSFSNLHKGGKPIDTEPGSDRVRQARRPPTSPTTAPGQASQVMPARDFSGVTNAFNQAGANAATSSLVALVAKLAKERQETGSNGGAGGAVPAGTRAQLIRGFEAAGRPDLAKMVKTRAFDTWIGQESGWRTNVVSPANNQGLRNGGLFQIWYGHDFSDPYERQGRFTASAYKQAQLVARHFSHLDPADIRRYARAIRAGTYSGWG